MTEQPSNWEGQEFANGRYTVLSLLGSGGMADVYRVFDRQLNSEVAVKVPKAILVADGHFGKRFEREIAFLAKLRHPHIVSLIDSGVHRGHPYAVFQYLAGGTLKTRLQSDDPMIKGQTLRESLKWLLQIASALDFLHKNNVLHRDVKPENIYFNLNGDAFLGDFGVIRSLDPEDGGDQHTALTSPNTVLGTCAYMSPELIMGQTPYTAGIDQYSLAVTAYEFLCGKRPFDGSPQQIMIQHLQATPPALHEIRPELPLALSTAVQNGMSKDAVDRYPSCSEFAKTVVAGANVLTPTVAESRPDDLIRQTRPAFTKSSAEESTATGKRAAASKSRRWLIPIGIVVACVVMVGAWFAAARFMDGGSDDGPPNKQLAAKKHSRSAEGKDVRPNEKEGKKEQKRITETEKTKPKTPPPESPNAKKKSSIPKAVATVKKSTVKIAPPGRNAVVVSPSKAGAVRTITKAIQLSRDGDKIFVEPGVYRESVVLSKNVQLVGDGDKNEIVIESADGSCIVMDTDKAGVRGLTLKQLASDTVNQSAVDVKKGKLHMIDCDVSSKSGIGVRIRGESTKPHIAKCKIHHSSIGVLVADNAKGVIEDCDLTANSLSGAVVKNGADPIFRECRVTGDGSMIGMLIDEGGKGQFERCRIAGKIEYGFEIGGAGEPNVKRCDIGHCQTSGVYVHSGGNGSFVDCEIVGGVRSSVDVYNGNPKFRKCKVINSKYVGVDIGRKGKGEFEDVQIVGAAESGIDVSGDPIFRRCTIRDGAGCGLCVYAGGRGSFYDCTVKANAKANVVSLSTRDPFFSQCTICESKQHGVVIAGTGTFDKCWIQENGGHGFDIQKTYARKQAHIHNCKINRNGNVGVNVQGVARAAVTDSNLARNRSATRFAVEKNVEFKGNTE